MAGDVPTVTRSETELGWWELASVPVPPALCDHARSLSGYRMSTCPLRTREVPTGSVWLIIGFGDALVVMANPGRGMSGGRFVSFAVGPQDGVGITKHHGSQHGIQVELTPLGVRSVLGVAAGELAHRCVALHDLIGREAGVLSERLAEAASWTSRVSIVTDWLVARADDRIELNPEIAWVWRRLRRSRGRVAVAELARDVGWSRRHLTARFRDDAGLTPKTVARILRFEHATELAASHDRGWAEIAALCGYYDQAHLIRDFGSLVGLTPTEFASLRPPGLTSPVERLTG